MLWSAAAVTTMRPIGRPSEMPSALAKRRSRPRWPASSSHQSASHLRLAAIIAAIIVKRFLQPSLEVFCQVWQERLDAAKA